MVIKIKQPPIFQSKHLYKSASIEVLDEAQRCANDLYERSKSLEEIHDKALEGKKFTEDEYFRAAQNIREHKQTRDRLSFLFGLYFKRKTPIENWLDRVGSGSFKSFSVDNIRAGLSYDVRNFHGYKAGRVFDSIAEGR